MWSSHTSTPGVLCVMLLVAPQGSARAQPQHTLSELPQALEYHQEKALEKELASHVATVRVRMAPALYEDPHFKRFTDAMLVAATVAGRPVVLTSALLTRRVAGMTVDGRPTRAVTGTRDLPDGLVVLECPKGPKLCGLRPAEVAAAGCAEPFTQLLYLTPAPGGGYTLGTTVVLQPAGNIVGGPAPAHQGPLQPSTKTRRVDRGMPKGLILVRGRLLPGTALFDNAGRLAAVAVRLGLTTLDPTVLAARLCPARSEEDTTHGGPQEGPPPTGDRVP